MKPLFTASVLLASLAAGAAPAAPTIAPAAAPARPAPTPRHVDGMSDAGNAIFAKAQATPDPDYVALLRQQRALHDQLVSAAMASAPDVDKVTSILKQQEDVSAKLRTKFNDRNLAVLRQLPDADRGPFLRALMMPPAPARP